MGTVSVGCKAPNGLILNLDRYVPGPNNTVQRERGNMPPVTLRGWAHAWGEPDMTAGSGGYRITQVDAAFWDAWIAQNADSPLIAEKVIIPPHKDVIGAARDHAAVPAMHRPTTPGDVRGITPSDARSVAADRAA